MTVNQLWFVRHEGKVVGQFPIKEIARSISQGEIALSDEISPDQVNWLPLSRFPGLAPEPPPQETQPQETEEALSEEEKKWRDERAKAAIRWEHSVDAPHDYPAPTTRPLLKWLGVTAALLAVAGLGAFIASQLEEPEQQAIVIPPPLPNCNAAPMPKVNWRGCDKSGTLFTGSDFSAANLSRTKFNSTDLSGSRFPSANLTQADLSYATLNQAGMARANLEGANLNFAELRDADLSYANLRDTNLEGAVLDGAKLDQAIWSDGRVCAVGSLGQCR